MACGTPTITSNVSSIPEIVGDGAMLINPFNSIELAEAIHRILTDEDLALEYTVKGLARANLYSWEKTARITLDAYREFS
jgi:glycosyltransferase involved in cell wall biosynthesis